MRDFARLYAALDETTKTSEKTAALVQYFRTAPPEDAAWAVYFLSGRKLKQAVPAKRLREWAGAAIGLADWLVEECYHTVGDAAETVALLLPPPTATTTQSLDYWVRERLLPLRQQGEAEQRQAMLEAWAELDPTQRLVWNKLITGGFRVGVSQQLVTRALAEIAQVEPATIAQRLMGDWQPSAAAYQALIGTASDPTDPSRPYPFMLAHALELTPPGTSLFDSSLEALLGSVSDWQAEWKWDGIRAQLIRRGGAVYLWSRGEELVSERYPEVCDAALAHLPDGTVLDGELLPFSAGRVLPFAQLQKRIGRHRPTKSLLAEVPVVLLAYDLLESEGVDRRAEPLAQRRARLETLAARWPGFGQHPPGHADSSRLRLSPIVHAASWAELAQQHATARTHGVEGLMLKRRASAYLVGRVRGEWWKWKVAPLTVDAVLIYAQRGSGKRASLYTDYTFGVWQGNELVPIAKAYSGLTDAEIRQVDAFIRRNTQEKFGPVRTVKPELVFEIAFEAIQPSSRHKSGVAVRFPRILRWRHDKPAAQADTLERVKALLGPRP